MTYVIVIIPKVFCVCFKIKKLLCDIFNTYHPAIVIVFTIVNGYLFTIVIAKIHYRSALYMLNSGLFLLRRSWFMLIT